MTIAASEPAVSDVQSPDRRDSAIVRPALLLIVGRCVAAAATFIVPLVLARVLTPSGFGTYRQLGLIFTTIYAVAQLGMAESLFYFIPSDVRRSGAYAANAMLTLAVTGTSVVLLLASFDRTLATALGNPVLQGLFILVGVYIALMLVSAPLEIILISRGRHTAASIAYALSDIARALLVIAPALVWRRLDAILLAAGVFAACRLAATMIVYRRQFGVGFRIVPSFLGRQLAYALPLQLAGALEIVQGTFHSYAVSSRVDAATFAVYSVGCLQIPLVDLIAGSACGVMMVRMRERVTRGDPHAILPVWHETVRKLALVLVPLLSMLWIIAPDLLSVLFTERFIASTPIFRIWLGVLLLATVPAHGPLRVLGDTRFLALQTFMKLTIVAIFTLPALSKWGLPGAVLVALAAMLLGKSALLVRLACMAGSRFPQVLPWGPCVGVLLASAVAALPALAARSAAGGNLARLVLTGPTYLIVFAAIVWCFGTLDRQQPSRTLRSEIRQFADWLNPVSSPWWRSGRVRAWPIVGRVRTSRPASFSGDGLPRP